MVVDSRIFKCDWLPRWGPQEEQQSHLRGFECKDTSSREGREEKIAPERKLSWLLWRKRVRRVGRYLRGRWRDERKRNVFNPFKNNTELFN